MLEIFYRKEKNRVFFFQTMFDFFFSVVIFFQKVFFGFFTFSFFFAFIFFKRGFDSSFFLNFSLFLFFLQKLLSLHIGRGLSQSPKPDSSLSYNLPLLGHGLGRCPKNLLALEVSSVSYEQIRVAIFFSKGFLILVF